MIGRRSIRIKSMQAIYALKTNPYLNGETAEKNLRQSISSFHLLYDYILFTLLEVIDYLNTDAEIQASKHLQENATEEVNLKMLSNKLYTHLVHHKTLNQNFEKNYFKNYREDHVIRSVYTDMVESEKYINYIAEQINTNEDDYKIFQSLINDILVNNEVFQKNLEDNFINFEDDYKYLKKLFQKQSKKVIKTDNPEDLLLNKGEDYKELEKFGVDIFLKTVEYSEILEEKYDLYLKNWDANRLALVDTILLKMALCELLYFQEIPVKVSINEYIDISKKYSTPKSKEFINGILDKMMKDLMKKGEIVKKGRGLKT